MQCPCCGQVGVTRLTILQGIKAQLWKAVSLVAAVSAALIGQAELIGEPWRHWLSILAIVATALIAWNLKQHPVKEETHV